MRSRRAFSLIEVMFAIVILGIGFLMVLAVFPISLQQAQESHEQTIAAQVAMAAAEALHELASDRFMPPTGREGFPGIGIPELKPLGSGRPTIHMPEPELTPLDAALRPHQIHHGDPRYAWSAAYARGWSDSRRPVPYAMMFIFVHKADNESFTSDDLARLTPTAVDVQLTEGSAGGRPGPDTISISGPTVLGDLDGRYIVISRHLERVKVEHEDGRFTWEPIWLRLPDGEPVPGDGLAHGRIYRIGRRVADAAGHTYELVPGSDMPAGVGSWGVDSAGTLNTAEARQDLPIRPDSRQGGVQGLLVPEERNLGIFVVTVPIVR